MQMINKSYGGKKIMPCVLLISSAWSCYEISKI